MKRRFKFKSFRPSRGLRIRTPKGVEAAIIRENLTHSVWGQNVDRVAMAASVRANKLKLAASRAADIAARNAAFKAELAAQKAVIAARKAAIAARKAAAKEAAEKAAEIKLATQVAEMISRELAKEAAQLKRDKLKGAAFRAMQFDMTCFIIKTRDWEQFRVDIMKKQKAKAWKQAMAYKAAKAARKAVA